MANYPLTKMNKEGTLLRPQHSYYSDKYAESMCDLFLSDSIVEDEHGKLHKYYRLHAKQPTIWKWLLLMISIAQIAKAVC